MLTFNSLFTLSYATICGVQLGETFVKKPAHIGAGQWIEFWEEMLEGNTSKIEELEAKIEELEDDLADAEYELKQKFGDKI